MIEDPLGREIAVQSYLGGLTPGRKVTQEGMDEDPQRCTTRKGRGWGQHQHYANGNGFAKAF